MMKKINFPNCIYSVGLLKFPGNFNKKKFTKEILEKMIVTIYAVGIDSSTSEWRVIIDKGTKVFVKFTKNATNYILRFKNKKIFFENMDKTTLFALAKIDFTEHGKHRETDLYDNGIISLAGRVFIEINQKHFEQFNNLLEKIQ